MYPKIVFGVFVAIVAIFSNIFASSQGFKKYTNLYRLVKQEIGQNVIDFFFMKLEIRPVRVTLHLQK